MKHRLARIVPFLVSLFTMFIISVDAAPPAQGTGGCAPDAIVCRVSVSSDGVEGNDRSDSGYSGSRSLSADGRFVAFTSYASNLVPNDTNDAPDVFVHDRQTGETTRVSVSSGGAQWDYWSDYSSISADGRTVAFVSYIYNDVVVVDVFNVFVHDRQTGVTSRISVSSDGVHGNGLSLFPDLSADGRFISFYSNASNLVPGDTNNVFDVFVHDRQTGDTRRVSVSSDGAQSNASAYGASISADGRWVAFSSNATNLVSGDTNNVSDVFVHDRQTGTTSRVSVSAAGAQGQYDSEYPILSADGRVVAFVSRSSNFVPVDTNNGHDVFVVDRQTGLMSLVSVSSDGKQGFTFPGNYDVSLSANGRFVTFDSDASNLVPGDIFGYRDVFVHDRQTGTTTRVSVSADDVQGNDASYFLSMSADGRFVAFTSRSSNLAPGDNNGYFEDVFVVDWQRLSSASLQVNILLQGRPHPDAVEAVPLAVTIIRTSDNAVIIDGTFTSDANGQFVVSGLPVGNYRIRVKHAHGLASALEFAMGSGSQSITVGMLRTGDADNNNMVTIFDFGILAAAYGKNNEDIGYDARADFNGDAIINVTDFSLLATNFGQMGAP